MDFKDFIGQTKIKNMLSDMLVYSMKTGKVFPHTLFIAAPGQGKTTLANCVASQLSKNVVNVYAPMVKTWENIKKVLPKEEKAALYIDEAHALPSQVQESLYDIMNNSFYIENGNKVYVPRFTIIASTTDPDRLLRPFMDRFTNVMIFSKYTEEELTEYIRGYCVENALDDTVVKQLIRLSKHSPRKLNSLLYRLDCYAVAHDLVRIGENDFSKFLTYIGLSQEGYTALQVQYLNLLHEVGAASLSTISSLLELQPSVVRDIIEPDLVAGGLVSITGNGRVLVTNNNNTEKTKGE